MEGQDDVLLKCLDSMLLSEDQISFNIPNPNGKIKSEWKSGTLTLLMNKHKILKNNDPNDTILKNILKKPIQYATSTYSFNNVQSSQLRRHFSPPRLASTTTTSTAILPVPPLGKTESIIVQPMNFFKTAKEQLIINDKAKGIKRPLTTVHVSGLRKIAKLDENVVKEEKDEDKEIKIENPEIAELMQDERMKNVDSKMVEAILNEVIEIGSNTEWDDIAGLDGVKNIIREIIIWPMLRPDIFNGLRGPPKGILFFGPPGTGKTMLGRLIATQSKSTFFNISASSLTSKWIGDGEKMVRTLFQVARCKQPSVIFIDEIDSILTQRNDTEHESSRRLKTEFLIQFDGCGSKSEDRILVIGVTNRPQELDEAARRRLVKKIYIPLPDIKGRKQLVQRIVTEQNINDTDYEKIAEMTDGYSGADMASLCKEAAYGPIRDIGGDIVNIQINNVRRMILSDFTNALKHVKASVMTQDLTMYENWDLKFGCHI